MNVAVPKTVEEYLQQLRAALHDADPALLQDALYDAEEYLRAELAEHPERPQAEVLAQIATSYGAPEEVADIYRVKEDTVVQALRTPRAPPRKSPLGRFFAVAADPRAYAALFYMLLALATGIFYFTWVVTGLSLSAGFAILIIGIPFVVLFFGSVRVLSLVEGRLVEVMLGERMPRRPMYAQRGVPLLTRIGRMFTDPRTWSTMLYMLLMLPLGIVYFTVAVTAISLGVGLMGGAVAQFLVETGINDLGGIFIGISIDDRHFTLPLWMMPLVFLCGVLLLFVTLHLARGIGHVHAQLAKHLLVHTTQ